MDKLENLLHNMADSLVKVCQGTEEEFLSVGSYIYKISEDSQGNSALANSVLEDIQCGDEYEVDILKSLFDEASGEIQKGVAIFSDLLPRFRQMTSSSRQIWNLQRSEHLLSIYMSSALRKIQVNQIYGSRNTEKLIREVKLMATRVNTAKHQMNDFIEIANKNYLQASQTIQDMGAYNLKLETNQQKTFSHLEELYHALEQSKTCCHQIQSDSCQISIELGALVTVLQYHDITKQQILHINEILRTVATQIVSGTTQEEIQNGATSLELKQPLEIQTAQLAYALWNTQSVDQKIKTQLEQICALSRSQTTAANGILKEEALNLGAIEALREELKLLTTLVDEHEEMILSMMKMFRLLETQMDILEKQLEYLIALGINLKSLQQQSLFLHATAETREEAALMDLLQEKITELNDKSQVILNKDVVSLKEMMKKTRSFQKECVDPLEQQLRHVKKTQHRFSKYVGVLIESFVERSNKIMTSVSQVSKKTNDLEHSILDLIPRFSFAQTIESALSPMKSRLLQTLDSKLKNPTQSEESSSASPDIEEYPSYTCAEERSIHHFCVDKGLDLTLSRIESGWENMENTHVQDEFDDGFADSVELF